MRLKNGLLHFNNIYNNNFKNAAFIGSAVSLHRGNRVVLSFPGLDFDAGFCVPPN